MHNEKGDNHNEENDERLEINEKLPAK